MIRLNRLIELAGKKTEVFIIDGEQIKEILIDVIGELYEPWSMGTSYDIWFYYCQTGEYEAVRKNSKELDCFLNLLFETKAEAEKHLLEKKKSKGGKLK